MRKVILKDKRSRLITAFYKAYIVLCTWRYHLIFPPEDYMRKDNQSRKTFIMFLLACLIGFFIVSFVEVLRSSFAPMGPGPDVQTAAPSLQGTVPELLILLQTCRTAKTHCRQHQHHKNHSYQRHEISLWRRSPFDRYFGAMTFLIDSLETSREGNSNREVSDQFYYQLRRLYFY